MVGVEGFEVSFPSGRYAILFVGFNCTTTNLRGLPEFSGMPFFPNFLTKGRHFTRDWYHVYSRIHAKGEVTPSFRT
jgi:hypothetical protein